MLSVEDTCNGFSYRVNESALAAFFGLDWPFLAVLFSALAAAVYVRPPTQTASSLGSFLLTLAIHAVVYRCIDVKRRLHLRLEIHCRATEREVDAAFQFAHREFAAIDLAIASASAILNIDITTPSYSARVRDLANSRALLTNPQSVLQTLAEALSKSRLEAAELATACELHLNIAQACATAKTRGGAETFIADGIRAQMESDDAKRMLSMGNWSRFREFSASLREALEALEVASLEAPDKNPECATQGTSRQKAYQILGLPPAAPKEEIQKSYRGLCRLWHPDLGAAAGDEEIKAINWAYSLLTRTGAA